MRRKIAILFFMLLAGLCGTQPAAFAIGQEPYVQETPSSGSFPVVHGGTASGIYVDSEDWAGVIRAAGDLQADIERVTGIKPNMIADPDSLAGDVVIAGTMGKSRIIEDLIRAGKINAIRISGQWESFQTTVVERPLPGGDCP